MVSQNTTKKLPARLAWPFIFVNIFAAIVGVFMVISHSRYSYGSNDAEQLDPSEQR